MKLPTESELISTTADILKNMPREASMSTDDAAEQFQRYLASKQPVIIKKASYKALREGFVVVPCISPDFVLSHSMSVTTLAVFCESHGLPLINTAEVN